ncbi:MAG: metallophosphoesterase, partial [Anaeroplasmataceae bacterium]|nr:metallophosphoesterase [Anaeroplasmataceae bacterium]
MRIAMLIVGAIAYYIIWIILTKMLLKAFQIKRKIPILVGVLIAGSIPLFCVIDYIWRGIKGIEILAYIGYIELGFFIYYVLSLGFVMLVKKIYSWFRKQRMDLTGKSSILISGIMSVLICLWGILGAQIPEYTCHKVDIGVKEHLKVTVVSDIHYGATGSLLSLDRMVNNINKTNPDVVLLVGDVFDNKIKNLNHTHFVDSLNKISSKYGVYAVTGNHEFMQNSLEEIVNFYEGTTVRLLLDEEVIIHDALRIVGRIDHRGGRKDLNEVVSNSNLPLIVLDHQPQFYREAKDIADLQISGHTHNGQIFPGEILIYFLNLIAFQSPSDGFHRYN